MIKYVTPFIASLLIALPGWTQTVCRSFDYRQQQLSAHPALVSAVQSIEAFTQQQLRPAAVGVTGTTGSQRSALPLITVPVVVHVLYNTSAENISDAQIQSQIAVLNADYQKLNGDTAGIPGYYSPLAANCGFRFMLAGIDTNGNTTTGIIRKHTSVATFSITDNMKSSATGGDDAWDRDKYLNIWVCNLEDGVLGYSSVVGCSSETDGVVVLYTAFGTSGETRAPFNLGRTCTHEIGHWLNMIHVWGDADCGDDQVADTPPQSQATYGDPSGIILSCGNTPYGNMYMDYMDFTDDIGMHMFTYGQRDRMRTLFAPGGTRYALLSSPAATAPAGDPVEAQSGSGNLLAPTLYPNPAVSTVSLSFKDASQLGSVLQVYNQMGQLMMATRVTSQNLQLNVAPLAGGIYFIRLGDSRQSVTFVKL